MFNIRAIDDHWNYKEYEDPLLLKERECNINRSKFYSLKYYKSNE